jgi:hypothetical protein
MATPGSARPSLKSLSLSPKSGGKAITHYLPFLDWLVHYRREDLVGDLLGGVIVAIMLVPQGMAYAMLAGLPPEIGLYASIVPLIIYGLLWLLCHCWWLPALLRWPMRAAPNICNWL